MRVKSNLKKLTDNELMDRFCAEDDLEVLGVLFNRYMHLVYGVCLKYLKHREESQDAVMQIFEVLVKEVPRHEIKVFKSWLYGVSRNFCLMKLRKEASGKVVKLAFTGDNFMESTTVMHPLDEESGEQTNEALQKCLEVLKKQQRKCVELFYYAQKCYKEIAAELFIEEKKVKSYIQNGKRNLKNCLESSSKTNG